MIYVRNNIKIRSRRKWHGFCSEELTRQGKQMEAVLEAVGNMAPEFTVTRGEINAVVERQSASDTNARRRLWHYTFGHKLPLIFNDAALRPNGAKIAPSEKPVLWFSAEQVFEPTAVKLVQVPGKTGLQRLSMHELHAMVGAFRFGLATIDERLIPWAGLQRRARISKPGVASMLRAAVEVGAKATNWYGTMSEVSLDDVVFEAWNGSSWAPADLGQALEAVLPKLGYVASVSVAAYGPDQIRQAWQAGARQA